MPSTRAHRSLIVSFGLLIAAALPFLSRIDSVYTDHDVLIYTLAGRGIYQHGEMLYEYAFDHKPFILYFFYGPFAWLTDLGVNIFAVFSAVLIVLTAMAYKLLLPDRVVSLPEVIVLLTAAALLTVQVSGNTELLFVFFEIVAVLGALRSRGRPGLFTLSAAAAFISANVNYLTVVPLVPALLYGVWASSDGPSAFIRRTLGYLALFFAFFGLALLVAVISGADVINYFQLQKLFLTSYSADARPPATDFLALWIFFTALILLPVLPQFRPDPARHQACVGLALLTLFSSFAIALSGRYYPHYLYAVAAPAVIYVLMLMQETALNRMLLKVASITASTLCVLYAVLMLVTGRLGSAPDLQAFYHDLRDRVHGEQVLALRSHISPFYFSGAEPYYPIVWYSHTRILFGESEINIMMDELATRPSYVLTSYRICDRDLDIAKLCAAMNLDYELVQSVATPQGMWSYYTRGYDLYALRGGEATGSD